MKFGDFLPILVVAVIAILFLWWRYAIFTECLSIHSLLYCVSR